MCINRTVYGTPFVFNSLKSEPENVLVLERVFKNAATDQPTRGGQGSLLTHREGIFSFSFRVFVGVETKNNEITTPQPRNQWPVNRGRTDDGCRYDAGGRRLQRVPVGTANEGKRVSRQSALPVAHSRRALGPITWATGSPPSPPRRGRRSRSLVDRPVPIPSFMQTSLTCASRFKKKIHVCFIDGNNKF